MERCWSTSASVGAATTSGGITGALPPDAADRVALALLDRLAG